MKVAYVNELFNNPNFIGICLFLMIISSVVFGVLYFIGSSNDQEVKEAKAESKAIALKCAAEYETLESKYRKLGVKSFEQHMRIKALEKQNRDLEYRITQLTKGEAYARTAETRRSM